MIAVLDQGSLFPSLSLSLSLSPVPEVQLSWLLLSMRLLLRSTAHVEKPYYALMDYTWPFMYVFAAALAPRTDSRRP